MNFYMKSAIFRGLKILILPALFVVFTVGLVSAAALQRLSAEFQRGEISTTATPASSGGGGTVVYDKQISLPQSVAYISFSAQGDTHGGAALKMTATVTPTDVSGNPTGDPVLCQPLATGVGATAPSGWYTL